MNCEFSHLAVAQFLINQLEKFGVRSRFDDSEYSYLLLFAG